MRFSAAFAVPAYFLWGGQQCGDLVVCVGCGGGRPLDAVQSGRELRSLLEGRVEWEPSLYGCHDGAHAMCAALLWQTL